MPDPAVAVGVEVEERRAGEVGAVVDEFLCEPVPAGVLRPLPPLVLKARLHPHRIGEINDERALQHALRIVGQISVVAFGVLPEAEHVIASRLVHHGQRATDLGFDLAARPGAGGEGRRAGGAVDEQSFFRTRGLWNEVEIACDGAGAVNRGCRAAHDVHATRRAEKRHPAARIDEPAHAAKVDVAERAAHIRARGDAEERGVLRAGCDRDKVVGGIDAVEVDHLFAHRGNRSRRFKQRT